MLLESVDQGFRQGMWEWPLSLPQCLGLPLGRPEARDGLMAGDWNHLEAFLLACLVADPGCWLGPELCC